MWYNSMMQALLRSPIHGVISKNFMLISYTGRKSGKAYTTPVNYVQEDGMILPISLFSTESGTIDSGGSSAASVDMPSFTRFDFGLGLNYQIGDFLIAGGATF